ncbi:acetyl/propionyl-CoA carboxylase subuit alpha [Iodidimonas muriae]|uniref:propionyl-CoA carboxylase n=1 Tax=Iodidimonas muriae TaxID=261467 RepID=A0ABQ2LCS7_9PROT|nr:acetyl/propionyl/methylcrotonyl-CoA carboxylase subunit alpha [Iodidimonas muriae]GGO10792.1 acetyl/propionyl-CoA carboxylase subuit alpha [Iodidimonas muriae]
MFEKILIANRGEIACRIIKTAKRMGIRTVAVYSDADADALHVEMADEHVHIGEAPAAQSYLLADKIIKAAKDTGAQAIHPGFGFLSENAKFVEAVEAAGLVFIGPTIHAISAMGDKIESKRLAQKAGVSTVPGYIGEIADDDEAVKIAADIGYPVMIKASAGGGGKGMRIAWDEEECREGFLSARSEARSSFGDERIFIEKYIVEPRHIEIQILGDSQGTVLYLGERECSIQRRHQKVIEEAPSPFIDEATRKAMGEQAVALSKAVDYRSAGTVEFIVDKDRNFYFLEMNTRLQVEHPVTEMITGLDLVEQMIKVAAGQPLGMTQEDIRLTGWAIESRIYAEDPYRNFLPSIGRLTRYRPPAETGSVRNDTGVFEGAEISMYYDPMIAKLATWGETREAALAEMRTSLDQFYIRGIAHNIPFLGAVMAHPRFAEGRLSTNFIAEEYPDGFEGGVMTPEIELAMRAAACFIHAVETSRDSQMPGRIASVAAVQSREWIIHLDDSHVSARIYPSQGGATLVMGGKSFELASDWTPGKTVFSGTIDGRPVTLELDRLNMGYQLSTSGVSKTVTVLPPHVDRLMTHMPEKVEADTSKFLLCPMPGLVVAINVTEGDEVKAGQALAVVEAMKMENILRAERDGTVSAIKAGVGDSLAVDQVILEFE